MIEIMFPQTVSNILDYDGIKAAAKKYVEDTFIEIVKSFGENLILQTMDEEHLSEVTSRVAGDSKMSIEDFLDYINTDNVYNEFQFVSELHTAFPVGVEYKEFEVTGWGFPDANFHPFNNEHRSYWGDTARPDINDPLWINNHGVEPKWNLALSRFKRQIEDHQPTWHKVSGRRSSWGNSGTWMTSGGFGKPASIHINVDEERTVITDNGLTQVENWLGTVSNKLPINLYIEINDKFRTENLRDSVNGLAGSSNGYYMSFPYEEEETICTNDPNWPQEIYYTNKQYEGGGIAAFWVNYDRPTETTTIILTDKFGNANKVPNVYLDKQILSDISGIEVSNIDSDFWEFMANSEDVQIYHQSVQIERQETLFDNPAIYYYNGLEGDIDGVLVAFGASGLDFYTPTDNGDFGPHILDGVTEDWSHITRIGSSYGMIQFNVASGSYLQTNKYIKRVSDLCIDEYKYNILDVTKMRITRGEDGKPSVSLGEYLAAHEFGSTFVIMMPFNWFGARYAFDNKGNQWDVTQEVEPEPEPPVPPEPEPPVVSDPQLYVIDNDTGNVLNSVNSPLSSAKPSVVTVSGNIGHIDNPE